MVEVTHTAWRELLHKHGLLPVADILEKYGIASAIDVSELKQDDFIALEDLGLKPFMLMKIKRWSTSGGVTDVLPSSSTVPPPALTSSVPLTVGDRVDNAQHDTENESDGSVSNDTGERESHEDCVLIDATETVIAHEESGSTSGKRAATGGTQDEASSKKTKSNMTAEQQTFVQNFKAAPSKVDKPRKLALRHVEGRGSSKHKNGARRADVKPETLTKRLNEFPTHFLKITAGQQFCETCSRNVGSSKDAVNDHISSKLHTTKMRERQAGSLAGVKLLACITEYKGTVSAESGGQQPAGFA